MQQFNINVGVDTTTNIGYYLYTNVDWFFVRCEHINFGVKEKPDVMKARKLSSIAQERGYESIREMIVNEIEHAGSITQAAGNLGVSLFAIQGWLTKNKLKVVRQVKARVVEVAS